MADQHTPAAGAQRPAPPRRGISRRSLKILVGAIVVAVAIGVLLWVAVGRGSVYYYNVSELLAKGPQTGVRVAGRLVPGSLQGLGTGNLTFTLHDRDRPDEVISVAYSGQLPDGFKNNPDADIVAEGTYEGGAFHASSLTAKCPSKYEAAP
jgi:cytochrome c-type biogenesis protein CcmE